MYMVDQLERALSGVKLEAPKRRFIYEKSNNHKVLDKPAERKRNKQQRKARRNNKR